MNPTWEAPSSSSSDDDGGCGCFLLIMFALLLVVMAGSILSLDNRVTRLETALPTSSSR